MVFNMTIISGLIRFGTAPINLHSEYQPRGGKSDYAYTRSKQKFGESMAFKIEGREKYQSPQCNAGNNASKAEKVRNVNDRSRHTAGVTACLDLYKL